MKPVSVIGMGMSGDDLTSRHLTLIRNADILVGGKRHLGFFQDVGAVKKEITKDLKEIVTYIKRRMKDKAIVVLASGDPLFYGIGSLMIKRLGEDNVIVYPNVSTISTAFARIKEPWQDTTVISLHGKSGFRSLFSAFEKNVTVAVLTDPRNHPGELARLLLNRGITDLQMCILEQLGSPSEKVRWFDLKEAENMTFKEPNIVIFKRNTTFANDRRYQYPGLPEKYFEHEHGLITKSEIRAVSLSKLRLANDHIVWDLGAGSGAVAIEACLLVKKGRVIAVEKNTNRIEQIKVNRKRFRIKNLDVYQAELPDGMADLPRPDRIFIGGGGQRVDEIIRSGAGYLKPDGVMVVNTVLIQNLEKVVKTLQALQYKTDVVQVQISRSRDMPWGQRFEAENPVWVISGERLHGAD